MAGKIVLCRCEDVTLSDVERAIKTGFADLEEVKRYTGFGTGPCQGKECLREIAAAIARLAGVPARDAAALHQPAPAAPHRAAPVRAAASAPGAGGDGRE